MTDLPGGFDEFVVDLDLPPTRIRELTIAIDHAQEPIRDRESVQRGSVMGVSIDEYGRIIIPKPMREAAGLDARKPLHLTVTAGDNREPEIVLCPEHDEPVFASKGHIPLVYSGTPAEVKLPALPGGECILVTGKSDAVESVQAARRKHMATRTDLAPNRPDLGA